MASLPAIDMPPLASVQRRANATPALGRRSPARVYIVHLAEGLSKRVVVNHATAAVLDRLIAGKEVRGGTPAVIRAVAKARAAGVSLALVRVPRADGGAGHVALYRLKNGTSLEVECVDEA